MKKSRDLCFHLSDQPRPVSHHKDVCEEKKISRGDKFHLKGKKQEAILLYPLSFSQIVELKLSNFNSTIWENESGYNKIASCFLPFK